MVTEPENERLAFPTVLEEGLVVAGILLVWGVFAAVGVGISNLGGPGDYLVPLGESIAALFLLAGVGNALLYVLARAFELSG